MSVKAFFDKPGIHGYGGDGLFSVTVEYQLFSSTGERDSGTYAFAAPVGATPLAIYGDAFSAVVARCAELGWDTPTKDDVFGYLPVPFSQVLP